MKTTDLFKGNRSSRKLNESLKKNFGKKLNLEGFNLEELQDARNKLRTKLSQMRSKSGFNENLENDMFHKAQWMLDAINSEISEREEYIVDNNELSEGAMNAVDLVIQGLNNGELDPYDVYSAPSDKAEQYVSKLMHEMIDEISYQYRLHPDDDIEAILDKAVDWLVNDYGPKHESKQQGNNMSKVTEGEIQQASAIVTAKTMVDKVSRWIEELSGMENETMLQLGDSIRDEMGQEAAKQFISSVAPTINNALDTLKTAREELSSSVRTLTGEESPMDMLGDEPEGMDDMGGEFGDDEIAPAEPDAMVEPEMDDEFGAADSAAGGAEVAGRMKRESIERGTKLMKILAG